MKRVLVVGDCFVDRYSPVTWKKSCPEALGAQVYVRSGDEADGDEDIVDVPGGAANVALSLVALSDGDLQVTLVGRMSTSAARLIKRLSGNRVDLEFVQLCDQDLVKERLTLADGIVMRLDSFGRYSYPYDHPKLLDMGGWDHEDFDAVILSDYAAGTVSDDLKQVLVDTFYDRLFVDTKDSRLERYHDSLLCKLNWDEAAAVKDITPERFFRYYVVTQGALGATLSVHEEVSRGAYRVHSQTLGGEQVPAVDVSGCGDTFLAGVVYYWLCMHPDMRDAVRFANVCAADVVRRPRTAVPDRGWVMERWEDRHEVGQEGARGDNRDTP